MVVVTSQIEWSSGLTEQQARDIFAQGEEAVVFVLLQLAQRLAAVTSAANQSCVGEHLQVLRDRLPRDRRLLTEVRDRAGPAGGEAVEQFESRFVAECREERRGVAHAGAVQHAGAASARHASRCS